MELNEQEWNAEQDIAERVGKREITLREFLYRLAFTRHDSMDLLQLFLLCQIVSFNVAFFLAGFGVMKVTIAAWSTLGGIFALIATLGASTWRGQVLVAQTKVAGELSGSIARASAEPNMWKDDERGEFKDREPVD